MKYLIFDSESEAIARSDQGGEQAGLAYHTGQPNGSRYMWAWISEDGGNLRSALCFKEFEGELVGIDLLTPAEVSSLVNSLPKNWRFSPAPFSS